MTGAGALIAEPVLPDSSAGRSYICGGVVIDVACVSGGVHTWWVRGWLRCWWESLCTVLRADLGRTRVHALRAAATGPSPLLCVHWTAECGQRVVLNAEEPVACHHCLCRILYKTRTTRVTQFLAR